MSQQDSSVADDQQSCPGFIVELKSFKVLPNQFCLDGDDFNRQYEIENFTEAPEDFEAIPLPVLDAKKSKNIKNDLNCSNTKDIEHGIFNEFRHNYMLFGSLKEGEYAISFSDTLPSIQYIEYYIIDVYKESYWFSDNI